MHIYTVYIYIYTYTYIYIYTDIRTGSRVNPAVVYQLCHFSSQRLEEKWHNWYSTALFLYTTSAF